MQFIESFGINGKILIAQVVNFAIVLFILYKIGYKPMMEFIKTRTETIEKGVKQAEEAKTALDNARKEQEKILSEALKEASKIVETAQLKAKERGDEMIVKAKNEVQKVVKSGKKEIETQRQKMLKQVKAEVVTMVIESTEKILGKALDKKIDEVWLKNQLTKKK